MDLELGVVEIHSLRDMRFSIRAKLRQVGSNVSVSYGLSEQPYVKVDERLREELDEYLRLLFVEKPDAEVEPATSYCDVIDHYKCAWLMQLPWAAAIIVLPLGVTWAAGSLLVTVILALLAPTTIRIARRRPVRSVVPRDFYVEGAKRLAFTAAVATAAFVWRYVV